jgi:oligopeptidase A
MALPVRSVPVRDRELVWSRSLAAMLARTDALLTGPLHDQQVAELVVLRNNATYLFLYLDANDELVDASALAGPRAALLDDPVRNSRLASALAAVRCADPDLERSRRRYVELLTAPAAGEPPTAIRSALAAADELGARLLARLGVARSPGVPAEAEFQRLCAATAQPASREKLVRAWRQQQQRSTPAVAAAVDAMVDARRRQARADGFGSVAERTFTRCGIDVPTAANVVEDYLAVALDDARDLDAEVTALVGPTERPADHLPYVLRLLAAAGSVATFDAEAVLDLATEVAARTFGTGVERLAGSGGQQRMLVELDGAPVGEIRLDLWDLSGGPAAGGGAEPERPESFGRPVAHIASRYSAAGGRSELSFHSAGTLLHEFGHAMNHLLLRRRIPSQGGLDYLPLERLDTMSMWFEQWAFHPGFVRCATGPDGLAHARRLRTLQHRRTAVERGLLAALDLELHHRPDGGVAEAYAELADRYGVADRTDLADLLPYFTWPMQQLNPGAEVSTLWGWASAAERFRPYRDRAVGELGDARAEFAASLDPDLPSPRPPAAAALEFCR